MGNEHASDVRDRFLSLVERIKRIPGIERDQHQFNDPVSEDTIRLIEAVTKKPLSGYIAEFYKAMNGAYINWAARVAGADGAQETIEGFIDLPPLEEVFGGEYRDLTRRGHIDAFADVLWFDEFEEQTIRKLKKHKVIEQSPGGWFAVTVRYDLLAGERVFIVCKEDIVALPITFEGYIRYIVATLGVESAKLHLLDFNNLESSILNDREPQALDRIMGGQLLPSVLSVVGEFQRTGLRPGPYGEE